MFDCVERLLKMDSKLLFFLIFSLAQHYISCNLINETVYERQLSEPYGNFFSHPIIKKLSASKDRLITEEFETKLDHFRPTDDRFVNFRFHANHDHYIPQHPLLIYFKDLDDFSTKWIQEGLMVENAVYLNAALFTADYRFFGENIPSVLSDASSENLKLLTLEQILGDASYLIDHVRQKYGGFGTQVIVWGSGFGGTIATYLRQKFTNLVDAAWSSNGLINFTPIASVFYTYLGIDLNAVGGSSCYNAVQNIFDAVLNTIENGDDESLAELQRDFRMCNPINRTSTQSVAYFLDQLVDSIHFFIAANHQRGIENFCRDIAAIPNNPLQSFIRWYNFVYIELNYCRINLNYESYIERTSSTDWNSGGSLSGERQRQYLHCTQLGLLRSNSYLIFPSNINLDYRINTCNDLFANSTSYEILSNTTFQISSSFGTYSIATRILFINGFLNNWLFYQQLSTSQYDSREITLLHFSKSADLGGLSTNDPATLHQTKQTINSYIRRWVNSFRSSKTTKSRKDNRELESRLFVL